MRVRAVRRSAAVIAAVLGALALIAAPALAGSLYAGPGPRPGPDILYEPPAVAPQLTNAPGDVWRAPPILVSGATAYRDAEFLYQDFVYDDHGAREGYDTNGAGDNSDGLARPNGTYTYPTDHGYASNAADLVELRVKPLADSTAFRVTLNTLEDPSLVAFSIALGAGTGVPLPFPDGANVRAPADLFLTVHPAPAGGVVGDLVRAGTFAPVATGLPATVDRARRQVEIRIPHADWDPGSRIVRLAAGVGLWDRANQRYLLPQAGADSTHPGGAGSASTPAAFFNVAFRTAEPVPSLGDSSALDDPRWWRDSQQGAALAAGDISALHADVDFAKLAAGTDDDSGVPTTGPIDRILPSHFEPAQGVDYSVNCSFSGALFGGAGCKGQYQGRLQPYAVYVPAKPVPARGYGMTLLLHSLSTNYNQFTGSRNQSQFGDRGPGSIVVTPEGRGPDGYYDSYAGADTFEVWADVARHYPLDPDWTAIAGYSMGGHGTFKLAEQFPDLFARGQPTVGASVDRNLVASLRDMPILMWNASTDELVPPPSYLPTAQALDTLGYRYELDVFAPAEHLTLAINDQYAPAAAFLGTAAVDRDPPRVTYQLDPGLDYANLGMVADHAYYLSGLRLRAPSTPLGSRTPEGTIDVLSRAFGTGDAAPSATQHGAGTLTGGRLGTLAYTSQARAWGQAPAAARADALVIEATNIRTVTIDAARARVDCAARLEVTSDGSVTVTLADCPGAGTQRPSGGCSVSCPTGSPPAASTRTCRLSGGGTVTVSAGDCSAPSIALPAARSCRARSITIGLRHGRRARVVRVAVFVNGRRVLVRRGRNLRRVTLRRLPGGRLTVRIVAVQSNGARRILTHRYRRCARR